MTSQDTAATTNDREIWREREGDYYSNSIFVTEGGGIGMNVGGRVVVRPIEAWHAAFWEDRPALTAPQPPAGVKREDLADWSDLPRDIYVVSAARVCNVVFDVQCCSVPMATAPEVRYVRADLSALTGPAPVPGEVGVVEPVAWVAKGWLDQIDKAHINVPVENVTLWPEAMEATHVALYTASALRTAEADRDRLARELEKARVAERALAFKAENFWAFIQGEYGVRLSAEDQEDHNVSEFFAALKGDADV